MSENDQPVRTAAQVAKLSESEFQRGAQVISAQMADNHTPPSASLTPAAPPPAPISSAPASAEGSSGSAATSAAE